MSPGHLVFLAHHPPATSGSHSPAAGTCSSVASAAAVSGGIWVTVIDGTPSWEQSFRLYSSLALA